jgi:hypothetical protein
MALFSNRTVGVPEALFGVSDPTVGGVEKNLMRK